MRLDRVFPMCGEARTRRSVNLVPFQESAPPYGGTETRRRSAVLKCRPFLSSWNIVRSELIARTHEGLNRRIKLLSKLSDLARRCRKVSPLIDKIHFTRTCVSYRSDAHRKNLSTPTMHEVIVDPMVELLAANSAFPTCHLRLIPLTRIGIPIVPLYLLLLRRSTCSHQYG